MLPPVDTSVAFANPKFDALYRDLCANKLDAHGCSKLDAKALKERQTLDEDLHKARIETAKRDSVRKGLQDLAYRGDGLPDELRELVAIIAVTLGGQIAEADRSVVEDELQSLEGHATPIARTLSKHLEQDTATLAQLLAPDSPPPIGELPASIMRLQTSIATSRSQLSHSRLELAQDVSALHDLYRQITESSIRILEQTIHGSVARGTKAKAEYLAIVAEGMSKKLQVQHGQLLQQVYSPERQESLRSMVDEADAETKALRRRIREAEEKLAEYRQVRGMESMAQEYAEILRETEKVQAELARLEKSTVE